MTWKAYLWAALLLGAFIAGDRVRAWRDEAATVSAIHAAIKAADTFNAKTLTHTEAAATHLQAIHADSQALDQLIQTVTFTPPIQTGGGPVHATFSPSRDRCPDYLAAPEFERLYDSGSTGTAPAEAGDLSPPHA